ncbi:MAG: hypothetical protein E6G39_07670 [Actinobacteria bacterium]|nr:MAG: hypothetical protein E6G39_07670 [Actinomycetota bacterium]
MSKLFSRRKLIGAGGVAALTPIVAMANRAQAAPLPATVVALADPVRVFDSRTAPPSLGGGKLVTGTSLGVSVGGITPSDVVAAAVFVNVTVTDTEGRGYLVVRASDLKGDRPLPPTSNVNWSADGQTVANLVITAVGGENTLEVHAGGSGRTHFIVDVQAYVPALVI